MSSTSASSRELGGLLRTQRERRKLTQPALAALGGMHHTAISHYESGNKIPSPALAARLDTVLDLGGRLVTLAQHAHTHNRAPKLRAPVQLPAPPVQFVGRSEELHWLDTTLGQDSTAPIILVDGAAGVGKTGLAVHWAHRQHRSWPDGALVVPLHGHSPTRSPVDPHDALGDMLGDLGVTEVPADREARGRLLRSLLHERRMLLILDDAADTAQIRPLLVGSPGCTTIITSRRRLPGLTIQAGATRLHLSPLSHTDSAELLGRLLGALGDPEPAPMARIAESCAGLPLAVHATAVYLTDRPGAALADTVEALTGPRQLHLLNAAALDDPAAALRAVFASSYRQLSPESARLFRLIGTHEQATLTADDAAQMLGTSPEQADPALTGLLRENVIARTAQGYHCHGLLRAYAAELARADDS